MQTIMAVVLEESEDDREDLILNVLSNLGRNKNVRAHAFGSYCIFWYSSSNLQITRKELYV